MNSYTNDADRVLRWTLIAMIVSFNNQQSGIVAVRSDHEAGLMVDIANSTLSQSEPYTPGLSHEYVSERFGIPPARIAKLGSAENPFGASPAAVAAVKEAALKLNAYPEWTAATLREKIAERYGLMSDQIVCGAGETELISCIIRAFAGPGDAVIMHEPCFPIYHIYAENEGRRPLYVPMGVSFDFQMDRYAEELAKAHVRIAFLTLPHSPSGLMISRDDVKKVCESSRGALVVVDEAYVHFSQTTGCLDLVNMHRNLLVLRTFSKAFGLAGLRVGFAAGTSEVVAVLRNIKPTWNLGHLQVSGACAALNDDEHVNRTVALVVAMREYVTDQLRSLSAFRVVEGSCANFFLLESLSPELDSTRVFRELLQRGVIVKDCSRSFRGLGKRFLRVDVSVKEHMDQLVNALGEIELWALSR